MTTTGFRATAAILCVVLSSVIPGCARGPLWEGRMADALAAYQQGRHGKAGTALREALAEAERSGPDDPRVAATLNALAMVSVSQGRTDEAEALYRRALGIQEHALGPDDVAIATTSSNLASL